MKPSQNIIRYLKYFSLIIICYLISFISGIAGKKRKLAVLYLYADKNKYPDAYNNLTGLLKSIKGFEITTIKVDNFAEQKKPAKQSDFVYDIGGDNTYWEFSGWQKGLSFLEELKIGYDLVMFVNDSFMNLEEKGFDLRYYKTRINTLTLLMLNKSVLGVIDSQKKNEVLSGYDVSSWIRTNLFVIPYHIAVQFKFPLLSPDKISEIFPDKYTDRLFLETDLLNLNLKESLNDWITKRWQYRDIPNPQNYSFLRSKLVSILNERLFTAKLREMNVPIVNIDDFWQNTKPCKFFAEYF